MKFNPVIFYFYLFASSLLITYNTKAQSGYNIIGARANAMGNASVALEDGWSAFNNVANMASEKSLRAMFSYYNRYGFTNGLNTLSAGVLSPVKLGVASLTVNRFSGSLSDNTYSEQNVSLGYAHELYGVNIGARANYLQYNIEGYGTKGVLSLDLGVKTQLKENLTLAAYIHNITQSKVTEFEDERTPSVIQLGLGYQPIESLFITVQAEKDLEKDPIYRVGLEYEFIENFYGRTGVSTDPTVGYFGLGVLVNRFLIDYAIHTHPSLGLSHQVSISVKLREFENQNLPTND